MTHPLPFPYRNFSRAYVILLILPCFLSCTQPPSAVIEVTEDMVINETGSGEHMAWFDEQDVKQIPTTYWNTYGMSTYWPAGLIIDFGREFMITELWVFDGDKVDKLAGGILQVSNGEPFNWEDPQSLALSNGNEWVKMAYGKKTRYLQLQKQATATYDNGKAFPENHDLAIREVVIMGYPIGDTVSTEPNAPHNLTPVSMDEFIGMNSYIHTPNRVHDAVGVVREYRPWRWNGVMDLETPIDWGEITDKGGRRGSRERSMGNSDAYYEKMKAMGVECVPCIHRHVDEWNEEENIPHFGGDPGDPFSYELISDYSFQFVARYGHNEVADNLLRTTEASPKKSGLGLIRYFENWNEPNGWWGNPTEHFTPYQFAAFCSASYDGHLNQMGEGFGVKNADPNIKFVFGGLAELSLSYVQAMKLWSDRYRNGSFPADVINLHHYCNTVGKQHGEADAYGISPEEDQLKAKLEKVVAWRDRHLPGKELWLSEFGWDTHEGSYQSAAFGHKDYPAGITMNEIQGQWLTRAYLIGAAAGLDRMMMYLANDIRNYPHDVYGWCGFITVDNAYKPSWYYVKTLRDALTGMVFHDEYPSENENVWVYRFKNPTSGQGAYVLWCPTADGTAVADYTLKLTGNVTQADLVTLADKHDAGIRSRLAINGNAVPLAVSERPIIVLTNEI